MKSREPVQYVGAPGLPLFPIAEVIEYMIYTLPPASVVPSVMRVQLRMR
ncbi:MAG TPA: hypothetical protein VM717_06015 [Chthoniobacterales bacterium]|nr:hypothetical protein [Chthoniobacterales bacterium]